MSISVIVPLMVVATEVLLSESVEGLGVMAHEANIPEINMRDSTRIIISIVLLRSIKDKIGFVTCHLSMC